MKTATNNQTKWRLKLLPAAVFTGLAAMCVVGQQAQATDLEIYAAPTKGGASVMMMLDTSGSMSVDSLMYDELDANGNKIFTVGYGTLNGVTGYFCRTANTSYVAPSVETKQQVIYDDNGNPTTSTISYDVNYCVYNNKKYYDRLSKLKDALIPVFANPKVAFTSPNGTVADFKKYNIGLSEFFSRDSSNGNGGKVIYPVKPLTLENRIGLLNKLKGLKAYTSTPLANAYAEAGSYMLGTSTASEGVEETRYYEQGKILGEQYTYFFSNRYRYSYYKCNTYNDTPTNPTWAPSLKVYECADNQVLNGISDLRNPLNLPRTLAESTTLFNLNLLNGFNDGYSSSNGLSRYYLKKETKVWRDGNSNSGFDLSVSTAKNEPETYYDSPITTTGVQCDGYGIYMLTDGEPNGSSYNIATGLMNSSLAGSSLVIGNGSACLSSTALPAGGFGAEGQWACMGDYAKALRNNENPKRTPILTAAVGFGATFKSLASNPKVSKTITTVSGESKTVQVYQCDLGATTDAKNLCKLGEKGEGFGEGGFYYTSKPSEIADSIVKFVNDVSIDVITPISTGNISAPLDVLSGGSQSRKFAYLPILDPKVGQKELWLGNLKKYKVADATLKGGDNDLVFKNQKGEFATDTHDLWNTLADTTRPDVARPDKGMPQIGGAYQKIFENASIGVGERNLFVNSAGALKNLKVTSNKPVNFDALSADYDPAKKRTLLNFMGYNEPATTVITDSTTLTATKNKWLKNHGGVLHSLPQLITTEVELDAAGQLKPNTRKDYLLYGSMDGALHVLDDATGTEKITFVPKQILDLQPAALIGVATTKSGKQPYGIDAPWLVTSSYDVKTSGTGSTEKTTYEIDQAFAAGGMRMGGSMYYALDLSNLNNPKLIYSVGSNYANRLEGDTTSLQGIKNDVMGATNAEQQAFANMGQTWGKPTAAYVKSGGKRVMVNILPGGYDTCYEKPNFKLNTTYTDNAACSNVTNAQGSAVYMVQVGEEKKRGSTENEYFDTTSNNGKLLWWADNVGTGDDATSRSSSLQYSRKPDLKHSIVAQVRAIDRNYDGLTDIIYFADLGGQLWRADINNNKDTDNFKVDRVVKLLDVSDQASGTDAPPRIYERPFVTYYNGKYAFKDSANATGSYDGVTTLVTVGTGDRSNPVSATRNTPDAVYSIFDKDMARKDLFDYADTRTDAFALRSPTIKVAATGDASNKLIKTTDNSGNITADVKAAIENNNAQGWYLPLTSWLGAQKTDAPYKIKMFNEPDALNGIMVLSTYDPDAGDTAASCSAGVIGETQRENICLPYGVCYDADGNVTTQSNTTTSTSNQNKRNFSKAGGGIADNIVTQFNDNPLFVGLGNVAKTAADFDVACPSGNCPEVKVCSDGTPDCANPTTISTCTGADCDKTLGEPSKERMNPLAWLER